MLSTYRIPVLLFLAVLLTGLAAYLGYLWWYPRWYRGLAEEAQRRLHIALEEHYLEHNGYPPALDEEGKRMDFSPGYTLGRAPWTLLPKEGIPARIMDIARKTYYCSDGKVCWILAFPGLNNQLDMDIKSWVVDASGSMDLFLNLHPDGWKEYDPANGTVSAGDILRTGP